jgi:hypothetical protein
MSRRVPAAVAAAGLALLVTAAPAAAQTPPAPNATPQPVAATPLPPRPEPHIIPSVLGPRGEIAFPDPMKIVPDAVKMIFDNDDEEAAQEAEEAQEKVAKEVAKPAGTVAGEA